MAKKSKLDALAFEVASGSTIRAAAAKLGISESHAYTISSGDPEFKIRVNQIRSEAVAQAVGVLTAGSTTAAESLVRLLGSDDDKIVLAAASKLLGILPSMSELSELRQRIDNLETATIKPRLVQ
jgi:HEAT repeat protein